MKLFKRRIKRRYQPMGYIQPQPPTLLRTLQGFAPKPPIYDYAHFELTELFKAMTKEAMDGQIHMIVDCEDKMDEVRLEELIEWKDWLENQGLEVEFKQAGTHEFYIISWGED